MSYRIPKCESDSAFLREIQDTDIVKNEELQNFIQSTMRPTLGRRVERGPRIEDTQYTGKMVLFKLFTVYPLFLNCLRYQHTTLNTDILH